MSPACSPTSPMSPACSPTGPIRVLRRTSQGVGRLQRVPWGSFDRDRARLLQSSRARLQWGRVQAGGAARRRPLPVRCTQKENPRYNATIDGLSVPLSTRPSLLGTLSGRLPSRCQSPVAGFLCASRRAPAASTALCIDCRVPEGLRPGLESCAPRCALKTSKVQTRESGAESGAEFRRLASAPSSGA